MMFLASIIGDVGPHLSITLGAIAVTALVVAAAASAVSAGLQIKQATEDPPEAPTRTRAGIERARRTTLQEATRSISVETAVP